MPASARRFISSPVDKKITSAGSPFTTARAWSVDGPYDWLKETPEPAGVPFQAEMILPITVFGVEYATRLSVVSRPAAPATPAADRATSNEKLITRMRTSYLLMLC